MNWILLKNKVIVMKKYFKYGLKITFFKLLTVIREHRRWVVDKINKLGDELEFIDGILA